MKKVILVGDGMGDEPCDVLGGKTVLQAAHMPHVRRIAAAGRVCRVSTVPEGMQPGSDVANLSLLGYDPGEAYTGRAPIEAAGAGLALDDTDVALRCNLVTVEDGCMVDYSAGHIPTPDAHALMEAVSSALEGNGLRFHAGVSYRHLAIWRNGPEAWVASPPHDIAGEPIEAHVPRGAGAEAVRGLMEASRRIIADHPVTRRGREAGRRVATQIWLWGQGRALRLHSYPDRFGLKGGVVSAVDLVRGLGVLAGLEAPRIPGATGFLDTDYEAKVAAACDLLARGGFAYVHIEAPDECGHMGDVRLKVEACEAFDARVVGPVWEHLEAVGEPYRLIVATDHRTPCRVRGHTGDPVPLAILDGPVGPVTEESTFDEFSASDQTPFPAHEILRAALSSRLDPCA